MKGKLLEITPTLQGNIQKKRVAAYARVSCGKDTMIHSLAAQISYYHDYICGKNEWEFAGVYVDEAKTGTKDSREQFQEMLVECRAGKIDLILTKSVSRFARNTVTLLSTVRELQELGVDVFFEEQNLSTLSAKGEIVLTFLASFAQAESLSCSENCKWRIRKGFEKGRASTCRMLGYRLIDGEITLIPEEAAIAKRIFEMYLSGAGPQKISNSLNEEGVFTINGKTWKMNTVRSMLQNEKYMGDLLLQRYYVSDHLKKQKKTNNGELTQFYVENDHEPIISKEMFASVQEEIKRRSAELTHKPGKTTIFTGRIKCCDCGCNYRRKVTPVRTVWCCATFIRRGKKYCTTSKAIPEETLKAACVAVLGDSIFDADRFDRSIDHLEAFPENRLVFFLRDGSQMDYIWKDRSRSESWTQEMKEAARQRVKERV